MHYTVVSNLLHFLPLQGQICPSAVTFNVSSAKIPVCWCVIPCSLVDIYRHVGAFCCVRLNSCTLLMVG